MTSVEIRKRILESHGADSRALEELLTYNENAFKLHGPVSSLKFPLPDEPFVSAWLDYACQAQQGQVFEFLKDRLVQLNFPIDQGISRSDGYIAVTRRGASPESVPESSGLQLKAPGRLSIVIHQTAAGKIPILIAGEREDFVSLVRALTARNEPEHVPDSMGACIVSGYNNWDRINAHRSAWSSTHGPGATEEEWKAEFQRFITCKEWYQDRFILLSTGYYSSVGPEALGLSSVEWLEKSLVIRREHECAHYFTRQVFHSMRNHVLDELIADYAGVMAACGWFRADWFLHFMGLEQYPTFRAGGRLSSYCGAPPLSDRSFRILQRVLIAAAESLEQFSRQLPSTPYERATPWVLTALSTQTLEELAAPDASLVLLKVLKGFPSAEEKLTSCEN